MNYFLKKIFTNPPTTKVTQLDPRIQERKGEQLPQLPAELNFFSLFEEYPTPVLMRKSNNAYYQNKKFKEFGEAPDLVWKNIGPYADKIQEVFVGEKYFQVVIHSFTCEGQQYDVAQFIRMGKRQIQPFSNNQTVENYDKKVFNSYHQKLGLLNLNSEILTILKDIDHIFQATNISVRLKENDDEIISDIALENFNKAIGDIFLVLYFLIREERGLLKEIEVGLYKRGERVFVDIELKDLLFHRSMLKAKAETFDGRTLSLSDVLHQAESLFPGHQARVYLRRRSCERRSSFCLTLSLHPYCAKFSSQDHSH